MYNMLTLRFFFFLLRLRENVGLAKALNRAQRPVLIVITRVYRTAPSNALQVLAGERPLGLEVRI